MSQSSPGPKSGAFTVPLYLLGLTLASQATLTSVLKHLATRMIEQAYRLSERLESSSTEADRESPSLRHSRGVAPRAGLREPGRSSNSGLPPRQDGRRPSRTVLCRRSGYQQRRYGAYLSQGWRLWGCGGETHSPRYQRHYVTRGCAWRPGMSGGRCSFAARPRSGPSARIPALPPCGYSD